MASKKNRARASKDTTQRKYKKKTSALITEKVEYVDYKDIDLLSRFMSDRAKIRNRRVSGNDVQQQREVAGAIKIAREMALLPYARRVATQRTRPPRDGRPGRDRDAEGTVEAPDLTEPVDQDVGEGEGEAPVETVAPVGEAATPETEGEDLR
jgi:small subunit ribosomal protein S18